MYKLRFTNRMKKDIKLMEKRGKDMSKLSTVLSLLVSGNTLPNRCKDHALTGDMNGLRECHIEPDWLLVYRICNDELILTATATGTHADLFGK